MIRALFLPERLGHRRILAQRIAGISIHEDAVRCAVVYASSSKTNVERLISQPIEPGTPETLSDRTVEALKKLMPQIPSCHQLRATFPSSLVIFKELLLQFTDRERIRMVLEYEIESMLPFSIHETVTDFIITKTNKTEQSSQVLVAAVRNSDLEEFLALFTKANIDPHAVTVDLFAQYDLYEQIPDYKPTTETVALVELGLNATRIALVSEGQLRLTRHLQRGITSVIKLIAEEANLPFEEIEQKLSLLPVFQLGDETLVRIVQKHLTMLANDIQFTLNSFSMKLALQKEIKSILFTGQLRKIKGFTNFCTATMQIPCEIFASEHIFTNKAIKNRLSEQPDDWHLYTYALGAALVSSELYHFDLRRKQFSFNQNGLASRQLIVAFSLLLFTLGTVGVKGHLELNSFESELKEIEQREVKRLMAENIFPKDKPPRTKTLANLVRESERVVKEKLELWAPFAQDRMDVLTIWLEVTRIVNKKQFDVNIQELIVSAKDDGKPKVEVQGLFKSKTGDHFTDWAGLEARFIESPLLKIPDSDLPVDTTSAPDGGVNFSVKMRLRDS